MRRARSNACHAAAAEEAAELRRLADEDVSGIREWSKAEIARIREETERRISGRKADLEHELEGHGSVVETRIGRVDAFVSAFEAEMAAFHERLFAEEDPTRFAGMAEQLPEAPEPRSRRGSMTAPGSPSDPGHSGRCRPRLATPAPEAIAPTVEAEPAADRSPMP